MKLNVFVRKIIIIGDFHMPTNFYLMLEEKKYFCNFLFQKEKFMN